MRSESIGERRRGREDVWSERGGERVQERERWIKKEREDLQNAIVSSIFTWYYSIL